MTLIIDSALQSGKHNDGLENVKSLGFIKAIDRHSQCSRGPAADLIAWAYSTNLVALPDLRIGVLYENDGYETIWLVTFTLAWWMPCPRSMFLGTR